MSATLRKTLALEPGSLPSLHLSWFCGEALAVGAARAWAAAAPNSHVENIYGPPEATAACLWQPVSEPVAVTSSREIVAIGLPYPDMEPAILDEALRRSGPAPPARSPFRPAARPWLLQAAGADRGSVCDDRRQALVSDR